MNASNSSPSPRRRFGGWLSSDEHKLSEFRHKLAARVEARAHGTMLSPPVQRLSNLIHEDPVLRMEFTEAIRQARRLHEDPHGKRIDLHYKDIDGLMAMIDEAITTAPPFDTNHLVGCPINALLDWPMCMPSGFALFRSPALNAEIRNVLDHWSRFLSGPESRTYLTEDDPEGWFSKTASKKVNMSDFECHPALPHYGFTSWNDFFTRRLKDGARPIDSRGDLKVVVSACDATPLNLQERASLVDEFWIKSQPYSLQDIFTAPRKDLAQLFVGGPVYQGFLSAYEYHRWHAPVAGRVIEAYNVPGTYYSDVASGGLDESGPDHSQCYLTAVATRAIIVIDTGDAVMGKVACVFVGMAEVSSCVITVKRGQLLEKGHELGYFQFGGSTHCLIFQPGVIKRFVPEVKFEDQEVLRVGRPLAHAY